MKEKSRLSCKADVKRVVRKIIIKGDPGIGKTTLIKKIAFDWATGTFTQFIVVFVVFLKLVEPGDSIENVIINQRPELAGMNVTQKTLKDLLSTFGNRCLLILDGLDEHALGQNEDVLKIIRGQKLLYCNVIISSRPHSTKEIEKYFHTVVRVNGFTRAEAEKFAFRILADDKKVQDVLNFSPVDFKEGINLFNYPILLSFMCLLVREEDIDLSSKSLSSGEIYMRMVRCLYKKFTIRVGKVYQESEFLETLRKLGQLAFETLLSGNPLLQKHEVSKSIGDDAFKYGLLIGHEDGFLLLQNATADILVTFPHRSIQEFLGAFYFTTMLNEGKSIKSLLGFNYKQPIFMTNPLFLHFCLWLVRSCPHFPIANGRIIYEAMRSYILKRIDLAQLNLAEASVFYPALDFPHAPKMKDLVIQSFLKDVLLHCQQTVHLIMKNFGSINWTLTSLCHLLPRVTSVDVRHTYGYGIATSSLDVIHSQDCVNISLDGWYDVTRVAQDIIMLVTTFTKKKISLTLMFQDSEYSRAGIEVDLSQILHEKLKRLCIVDRGRNIIACKRDIPLCPELTHLSLLGTTVCHSVLYSVSNCGVLPKLQHLCFAFSTIAGSPVVPVGNTLTSLDWSNAPINIEDIKRLTNLQSLSLSSRHIRSPFEMMLRQLSPNISRLVLLNLTPVENRIFIEILESGCLSNLNSLTLSDALVKTRRQVLPWVSRTQQPFYHLALTGFYGPFLLNLPMFVLYELDISHSRGITGNLSELFCLSFPSLHTLILCDCGLNPEDLKSLVEATELGKLAKLRSLDISQNDDFFDFLGLCGQKSSLHSSLHLETLRISLCDDDRLEVSTQWSHMEQLEIVCLGKGYHYPTNTVVEAFEKGYLHRLKIVWLMIEDDLSLHRPDVERLNGHGVFVKITKAVGRIFSSRS